MVLVTAVGIAAASGTASAATFTVTTSADGGAGSLREAIVSANAASGHDTIAFDISGPPTVQVRTRLPDITGPLTIDGTSQPGYSGSPIVRINNRTGLPGMRGLEVTAGYSRVLALQISEFGRGVVLRATGRNTVAGNRLNDNTTGLHIRAGSTRNVIGGTTAAERNVFVANGDGILIEAANATKVQGNDFGIAPNGSVLPNRNAAIRIIDGAKNTMVGGTADGAGNRIANNPRGVSISGTEATGNVVAGNTITDSTAFGVGILDGARSNIVGGTTAAAANRIMDNGDGVRLDGARANKVQRNFIGFAPDTGPQGNSRGVMLTGGAVANTVGGPRATASNWISANGTGVRIEGGGTTKNVVAGNDIGVSVTPLDRVENSIGVWVAGAEGNTIGGNGPTRRNVISGNYDLGLLIENSTRTRVSANYIGLDPAGERNMYNEGDGVRIRGGSGNTIGGTTAGERNVISASDSDGVTIVGSTSNVVVGNYIGLTADGGSGWPGEVGNMEWGVAIEGPGADGNRIGGPSAAQRNVIASNVTGAIVVRNAMHTEVQGNYIGALPDGTPDGNGDGGVTISGSNNLIGGARAGAGNLLYDQVIVDPGGLQAIGNAILHNSIYASRGIWLQNGGNESQAAPVITNVTTNGSDTTITGTLAGGPPSTKFLIEAFASDTCGRNGAGVGQRYLAITALTTNAAGIGSFTLTVPAVPAGQVITATATRSAPPRNTSEFSACTPT